MRGEEWELRAECVGLTDLFYPDRGDNRSVALAKEVCSRCPVRLECYEAGRGERYGIWGGSSERSRREEGRRAGYRPPRPGAHLNVSNERLGPAKNGRRSRV